MKKQTFIFITLLCLGTTMTAIAQPVSEGNIIISAGYGFPNLIGEVFKLYEDEPGYNASSVGPVYLKGEYMVSDRISLGLNFAWAKSKVTYEFDGYDDNGDVVTYTEKINRSTYSVLARMNFHFGSSDKFDPYVGGGVGFRNAKWKYSDDDPNSDVSQDIPNLFPFGFEATVGARYFFTDMIGAYAEVGLAKSPFQIGLVAKFGG